MRQRRRGILASGSVVLFAIVVAAGVRSFFVQDAVTWAQMSEEPLTDDAPEWSRPHDPNPTFIAVYRFRAVALLRGIVSVQLYETRRARRRPDADVLETPVSDYMGETSPR